MIDKTNYVQSILTEPINYLVIGHLTADLTENGIQLGGTATFSGLTAKALGLRVGLVTSHAPALDIQPIQSLWMLNKTSNTTTTFKNISNGITRTQYLYQTAQQLKKADIPSFQPNPDIVHLGPVANEVDHRILQCFPNSLKCLTPQGWMRATNAEGHVIPRNWTESEETLPLADVAVVSLEDVQMNEDLIANMASAIPVFVVTENKKGARVYWHNDARFITAPEVKYLDDTGAGDIFATAFFYRYFYTRDPWEAGRFAVMLASWSVSRRYLDSIPTPQEINTAKTQLVGH
jgi:sugar/nucleoside kinase (ribokinase family)